MGHIHNKLSTILLLYSLLHTLAITTTTQAQNVDLGPEAVEQWFERLPHAKERLTKLHFYFHDTVTGKNNASVIRVAKPNSTWGPPTTFGAVNVMDDPLTEGPEDNSKIVGRAQGMFSAASMGEIGFLMTMNFVFTDGPFNGSTLSVLGHNPILHTYREMPIVGGSGAFRLARGIATARTVWFNLESYNAVVEYHLMVLHYY